VIGTWEWSNVGKKLRRRTLVVLLLSLGLFVASDIGYRRYISHLESLPPITLQDDQGNKIGEFRAAESTAVYHPPRWIRYTFVAAVLGGVSTLILGTSDWTRRDDRNDQAD
jgi:hypothetical protein